MLLEMLRKLRKPGKFLAHMFVKNLFRKKPDFRLLGMEFILYMIYVISDAVLYHINYGNRYHIVVPSYVEENVIYVHFV